MNLQDRISKLCEQIELKQMLGEDYSNEFRKLDLLANDLREQTKKIFNEINWMASFAANTEKRVNKKYAKIIANQRMRTRA